MKKYILATAIMLIGVMSYTGYARYEQNRLIDAITPHVKNASLRVANSARYETEADAKITYKELFEKLEIDIAEIDKRLIDVQTLASPKTVTLTDPIINYLKASQGFLRALLQKYRKSLALSSAREWTQKMIDEYRTSSGYGVDFAKRTADKAIKEHSEAEKEFNATIPELRVATEKLKEARTTIGKSLPDDALLQMAQLDAIIANNATKAEDSASDQKYTSELIVGLEPFVVQLADPGKKRYMKLKLAIELNSKELLEKAKQLSPKFRDSINLKLTKLYVDDVMTPERKIKLRDELIKEINTVFTPSKISKLYFTELIVQ